ncbi:M48 family metallopeptidase [Bacillus sp. FJAT-27251]|uniref:M48 family metallopeptidase n=1 Tax=Bacillus sp. FJAT-27251 TaxID=1684142 RepID=UPI000840B124|nr:M48 family metallopeptidase [Bacillus sp. FJAT-27251]
MLEENGLKNRLVHRKEKIYFAAALLFSCLAYLVLLFSIIGFAIMVGILLISFFFHALSMASIRRNGVRLSEQQFPDIYQKAAKLAQEMELEKMPAIYVMESMGMLNAFATRFFGKNMVVVYSEIFDLVEEHREEELMFVLAHEFAHLKRRHVLVHFILLPSMFVPFLGEAYLRACEYTCDRYAAYYVGNVEAAKEALSVLAIGKKLSAKMNKQAYVQQAAEESGFFAWLSEQLSSHPHLPKRINALDHWINPQQYPLVVEKKTGIIVGSILSIVLAASLTGAAMLFLEGATALTAFLEDPYLVEDEYMYEEDMMDFPPVIQAYMNEDMDQVQQLVAEGADVNEKDSDDNTALQYAVSWGDSEAAQWLIENGADVNTTDNWGSTPLINAVFNDADIELVELLLANGADKTIIDSEGKTAHDYAVENRDAKLRDLLK